MRNNMKKIPLIITALLLISAISLPGASAAKPATTIRGDADGNGKVNISDVTAIQRHCAQLETLIAKKQTLAADVDGNGYITIDELPIFRSILPNMRTPIAFSASYTTTPTICPLTD